MAYEIDSRGTVWATSEGMAVNVGRMIRDGDRFVAKIPGRRFGHIEITPDRYFRGAGASDIIAQMNAA